MSDYAGYAVAVTIRGHVFNDAILTGYHAGQITHTIARTYLQLPGPRAGVSFFFQSPQVILSGDDPVHAVLQLNGWGTMSWGSFPGTPESRSVEWQANIQLTPQVSLAGPIVLLSAKTTEYKLFAWQFDVLSGTAFSSDAQTFFNGDTFKSLLLGWLGDAIGNIIFPIIDFTLLGPFSGKSFVNVALKVVDGALLLGLDMDDGTFSTSGDLNQLTDMAGVNDVEVIVNPNAIGPLMPTASQQVQSQIDQYGATLDSLSISCEEGRFRVKGRASNTEGAVNFSLAAVPVMTSAIPGAIIPLTTKKTMVIPARSWPALSFAPADVSVDVDQAGWITLVEVIGSLVVGGPLLLAVTAVFDQLMISAAEGDISLGIQTSNLNPDGATPLVTRLGTPPTRFRTVQFEIHTFGLYIGIITKLEAPPAKLSGVQSIPSNYATQSIPYEVRLPFEALEDDPFLHVRWSVIDLDSGSILLNDDNTAINRLSFAFVPSAIGPGLSKLAVVCRIYRALGPFMTDLLNQTIRLNIGSALGRGVFVSWNYEVKVPQFKFDDSADQWRFTGNRLVKRRSTIYRIDKPCKNANQRSRFSPTVEFSDDLPFSVDKMIINRTRLCDYCFFGGPSSTIASL